MVRFTPNLTMLWEDRDPYDRFDAAAAAGFRWVEMHFPQQLDVDEVERRLDGLGLTMVLFDFHAGDVAAGERGIAALPDRVEEFRAHAKRDLEVAERLGTTCMTVPAGIRPAGTSEQTCDQTLVDNLLELAGPASKLGITVTLEPLNATDVPGGHLRSMAHAARLVEAVDHPNVRLQFDQYHASMDGEDVLAVFAAFSDDIAHVQVADMPGRHEPGTGSAPVTAFIAHLDSVGYPGFVGLEYHPSGDTDTTLAWLPREQRSQTT